MPQEILLNLNTNNDIFSVVGIFAEHNTYSDTILRIRYTPGRFDYIHNEIYLVISSFVNEIRKNGKEVEVDFPISNTNKKLDYASRIDFFKHLGVEYYEMFTRHQNGGNFIEIKNIPNGSMNISERFDEIFANDFGMDPNEIYNVGFMIDELICNMTRHSKSESGAYFYCQKFPSREQLEIVVVDSGIGIAKSLSKSLPDLQNHEYLRKSLEYEVTSGDGRGHGLYVTSEFIKRNNCEFLMISGANMLKLENKRMRIYEYPQWNGVILKLIINFDIPNSVLDIVEDYT